MNKDKQSSFVEKLDKLIEDFEGMCIDGNESEQDVRNFKQALLDLVKSELVPDVNDLDKGYRLVWEEGVTQCRQEILDKLEVSPKEL